MFFADIEQIVPFHDVDVMQIVWHGHYFKYFEISRTALMQKLNLDWPALKEMGYAMPVIDANVRYKSPLLCGKTLRVSAKITEFIYPALAVQYEIFCKDSGASLATGTTRQAYLEVATMQTCLSVPEPIMRAFREFKPHENALAGSIDPLVQKK